MLDLLNLLLQTFDKLRFVIPFIKCKIVSLTYKTLLFLLFVKLNLFSKRINLQLKFFSILGDLFHNLCLEVKKLRLLTLVKFLLLNLRSDYSFKNLFEC